MNIGDMKNTLRATLSACTTDNERLLICAAAIRAQAKCLGRGHREHGERCLTLMDAIERFTRGELTASQCREIVDAQPSERFELLDMSQSLTWHVDKFVSKDSSSFLAPRDHKRLTSVLPSMLHGCGVGDTPSARKAVNSAVLEALVAMIMVRNTADEVRGAA